MDNSQNVAVIASKWNNSVTDKLLEGALSALRQKGYQDEQIVTLRCPGAFEIPSAVQTALPNVDGAVAIGAVIRGETPHFDYICQAVSSGIMELNLKHNKPVTFGVLTTNTVQQAKERANANSDFGNKGTEAALALMDMFNLENKISLPST